MITKDIQLVTSYSPTNANNFSDFQTIDNLKSNVTSDSFSCLELQSEKINFFRFVTNGIFLNLIGVFGILGNLISMIILSRPQMRSSINYLLIGLARIDTVLIITSMLLFGLPGIYPYSGSLFNYYFK